MQLRTAAGIAISGVPLYNGVANGDVDAVMTEVDTMDLCLEHPTPQYVLHHHSLSPCNAPSSTVSSSSEKPGLCAANSGTACLDGGYMYKDWPTAGYGGVAGLA